MRLHQRTIRTAAVTTALVATVLGLSAVDAARATSSGTPARQAAAPAFLAPEDLPPHPGSAWFAGDVTPVLPENGVACLDGVLPAAGSAHREYWTELDTTARQVTVEAESAKAARTLIRRAGRSVRDCAAAFEQQYPGAEAELTDLGELDVQEGAHVYALDTAHPEGATDIHLLGIGRDGRTVTVVAWGRLGDLDQAPAGAFRETTRTAVEKLRR